ncbi:MAG: hypothetical protein JMDDDDMK_00813 [Acidobacteria bacterium]|nr:hypothetical protein [Acidobacteriota bacterium]
MIDLRRCRLAVFGHDLDVFGRELVNEFASGAERFDHDQCAEIGQGLLDDLSARKRRSLFDDFFAHGFGEFFAWRDQNRGGVFGMFGLREQIGGHEIGAGCVVSDDNYLARPGD